MTTLLGEVIQGSKPGDTFIRLAVHKKSPTPAQQRAGTQVNTPNEVRSQRAGSTRQDDASRDD